MLYNSQAFQTFWDVVHFNTTEKLSNIFSSIFSVSNKDTLLKDTAYCVAKHHNLKHYIKQHYCHHQRETWDCSHLVLFSLKIVQSNVSVFLISLWMETN